MDLGLDPRAGEEAAAAVRAALASTALAFDDDPAPDRGAWWRAGVADAVERIPGASSVAPRRSSGPYDAARSPRSTRGAMRA